MGPCIGIRLGPHLNGYCHILTSPAFPTSTTFPPSPRPHISPHPKALSPTPLPSQYRPPHAPYRPTKFDLIMFAVDGYECNWFTLCFLGGCGGIKWGKHDPKSRIQSILEGLCEIRFY